MTPMSSNDDDILWRELAEASNTDGFCGAWLALQCQIIKGVAGGAVFLPKGNDPAQPAAVWPNGRLNSTQLSAVAKEALSRGSGVIAGPITQNGTAPARGGGRGRGRQGGTGTDAPAAPGGRRGGQ